MSTINLEPGRYYAGASIPFFVPNSMIVSAVEELGAKNVQIISRDDIKLPFDPRIDPKYDDDWSEVIIADYSGPERRFEHERVWKWLIVQPQKKNSTLPAAPIQASTQEKKPAGNSAAILGLGLGAALLWFGLRKK